MAGKIRNVIVPAGFRRACIGLAIIFPGASGAAQWYSDASAQARTLYDDNIRLTSRAHHSVTGMVLAGSLKTGRRTEAMDVHLNGGAALKRYSGEDGLDINDFNLGVDATRRTERDTLNFNAAIKLDSTLSSEIQSSGLMESRKRRIKKNFALAWTHTLSERASLTVNYSHTDTSYKNAKRTGLADYTYQTIESMLSYSLNRKTVVSSTLNASWYKGMNAARTRTRNLGFMVGINHHFSETFSAGAGLGLRYARMKYRTAPSSSGSGFIASANIKRTFERMTVSGLFSRNVQPSGSGALLITDSLSADAEYRVDERLSLHLEGDVYRNASTDSDEKFYDRVFFSIQPKVRWRMTRRWLIEGAYRYRCQRYEASGRTADSSMVFLSARYIWPAKPSAGLW